MGETYYEILDVSPEASRSEIADAIEQKKASLQADPESDDSSLEQLRAARETLLDADARARYDRLHSISRTDAKDPDRATEHSGRLRTVPWSSFVDSITRWRQTMRTANTRRGIDLLWGPTVVRLACTLGLVVVLTNGMESLGVVGVTVEFGVVLGSLWVTYGGFELIVPRLYGQTYEKPPFSQSRFTLWPLLVVYMVGLVVLWTGTLTGTSTGGSQYAIIVFVYSLVIAVPTIGVIYVLLTAIPTIVSQSELTVIAHQKRLLIGVGLSAVFLFVPVIPSFTIDATITAIDGGEYALWASLLNVRSQYLSTLINTTMSYILVLSIVSGVVGGLWSLTVVPWRDRYDHGYSLRPGLWNAAVVTPLVCGCWLLVKGVPAVELASPHLRLSMELIAGGIVLYPALLCVLYLCRRWLDERTHSS